jgi:hypothetical protein
MWYRWEGSDKFIEILLERLTYRDRLEDGRIILKGTLNKYDERLWSEFTGPRIGTECVMVGARQQASTFHEMRGIY